MDLLKSELVLSPLLGLHWAELLGVFLLDLDWIDHLTGPTSSMLSGSLVVHPWSQAVADFLGHHMEEG